MSSSVDEITLHGRAETLGIEPTLSPTSKADVSQIGVSSFSVHNRSYTVEDNIKKWYVLRVRYNHDRDAYDELQSLGLEAFYAEHRVMRQIHGKRKKVETPMVPGLIFAHESRVTLEEYMFGHSPLSTHIRFYRDRTQSKTDFGRNPPLTVSESAMNSFRTVCAVDSPYTQVISEEQMAKIRIGDWVRVTDGVFKGVEGRTAIVKRQRCVLVELKGVCSVNTAFIPKCLLEVISGK